MSKYFVTFLLLPFLLIISLNSFSNEIGQIRGKLFLDDSWEKKIYISHIKSFDKEWLRSLLNGKDIFENEKESMEFFSNLPDFSPIGWRVKMNVDYHPKEGVKSKISIFDINNSQHGLSFAGDLDFKEFKKFISDINIGIKNHENFVDIYKPIFDDVLSTIIDVEVKLDSVKLKDFLKSLSSTKEGDLDIKLFIPENIEDAKLGNFTLEELSKIDLLEKPVE